MNGIVEMDLHGLTVLEAEQKIDRLLLQDTRFVYHIRLIHGYQRGTSIREMIWHVYKGHPKVLRVIASDNPGCSILVLREL